MLFMYEVYSVCLCACACMLCPADRDRCFNARATAGATTLLLFTHTDVAFMGALTAAYAIQSTALVIGASIVLGAGTAVMWTSVSEVVDSHCNDHNRGLTHAVFLAMCTSFRAVCNRVYFVSNTSERPVLAL